MGNTGVKGRIVYVGTNDGIPGLEVHAWSDEALNYRVLGKSATTTNTGNFSITYSEASYRTWLADHDPSIRIQVFVASSRIIYESPLHKDVKDAELDLGNIPIHRNHLGEKTDPNSWLVTNATLDPQVGDAVFLTQNNEIEWLVDGAAMFPAVTLAAASSVRSINFMNLNFWIAGSEDSLNKNDLLVTKFPSGFDATNPAPGPILNASHFPVIIRNKAASGRSVRVVVGDIPFTSSADTVDVNKKFFEGSNVDLRILEDGFSASLLHAKAVTVDESTAIVVGSTFGQGYFNDQQHEIHNATHRGSLMHDVSVKVTGPAVAHVNQSFATIFNAAKFNATPLLYDDPKPVPTPAKPVSIQILRTLYGDKFSSASKDLAQQVEYKAGLTSILESYQRAIANATEYIYIENQYFTNLDVARAILLRMKEVPTLEVILLVNVTPDMPGYVHMQLGIISQLRDELGDRKDRLGCYTLWSWQKPATPLKADKPFEIMPIYIHSKTAIVDEKWATTGSANTDGSALNYIQVNNMITGAFIDHRWEAFIIILDAFLALFAIFTFLTFGLAWLIIGTAGVTLAFLLLCAFNAVFSKAFAESFAGSIKDWDDDNQHALPHRSSQPYRHCELNIVAFSDVAGQPHTDAIKELRENLWKEHLGYGPSEVLVKPPSGWLELWNNRADDKRDAVKANTDSKIKIMKWQFAEKPAAHLKKIGIDNDKLNLREKADRFNYLEGKWEKVDG